MRDWAAAVATTWLDRGADGWRLDAAYAMPVDFVAELVARIRRTHPDAYLFGEVIHGDYAGFVRDTGLDSVTQYELHKAIWSSYNDANLFELRWSLLRHAEMAETFVPVTFVDNHDVTRLASRLADPAQLAAAVVVLFTVPGLPCVYYGDELGWTGVKEDRPGGDDAIRPVVPDRPEVAVVEAGAGGQARLEQYRRLLALRRDRRWLAGGRLEVVAVANHQLTYQVVDRRPGPGSGARALRVTIDLDHTEPRPTEGWERVATGPGYWIGERIEPT